jgi:ATP-dependent Clp protease ATP-binding subunit ClpA
MFLTTNRVAQFDEAFMSRIHISVGYDPLSDSAREDIWDGLFNKLREDYERNQGLEIMYDWEAIDYVKRSQDTKQLKWNGREIRNGKKDIILSSQEQL